MTYQAFEIDQTIFKKDELGSNFYIILQGSVGVYLHQLENQNQLETVQYHKEDNSLILTKVLQQGDSFGELALIYNKPRLATVTCLQNTHLAILNKTEFQQFILAHEEEKIVRQMSFFSKMPIFDGWPFFKIREIYLNTFMVSYRKKEFVFQENQAAEAVYIIKSGEFGHIPKEDQKRQTTIIKEGYNKNDQLSIQKKQFQISVITPHEIFGEEDIIQQQNRSFTVICESMKGELIMIKRAHFINKVCNESKSYDYIINRLKAKLDNYQNRLNSIQESLNNYHNYICAQFNSKKINQLYQEVIGKWENQSKLKQSLDSTKLDQKNQFNKVQSVDNLLQNLTGNNKTKSILKKNNSSNILPYSYIAQSESNTVQVPATEKQSNQNSSNNTLSQKIFKNCAVNLPSLRLNLVHQYNEQINRLQNYNSEDQLQITPKKFYDFIHKHNFVQKSTQRKQLSCQNSQRDYNIKNLTEQSETINTIINALPNDQPQINVQSKSNEKQQKKINQVNTNDQQMNISNQNNYYALLKKKGVDINSILKITPEQLQKQASSMMKSRKDRDQMKFAGQSSCKKSQNDILDSIIQEKSIERQYSQVLNQNIEIQEIQPFSLNVSIANNKKEDTRLSNRQKAVLSIKNLSQLCINDNKHNVFPYVNTARDLLGPSIKHQATQQYSITQKKSKQSMPILSSRAVKTDIN